MTPEQFKALLDKYSKGHCTPEEIELVEQWYNNISTRQVDVDALPDSLETEIWASIKPSRQLFDKRLFFKIAASIALIATLAVAFVFKNTQQAAEIQELTVSETDHVISTANNTSNTQYISLSDGSSVSLEPNSSIRYPKEFAGDKRVIELSGEAFFNVKPNAEKPFFVYSKDIITKVLGTSFRVKAFDRGKEVIVAVKTGKVSVYKNPANEKSDLSNLKKVILTPNQQVVYNRQEEIIQKELVEAPAIVANETTFFKMQFDGQAVTTIFEKLEEFYGIQIDYNEEILRGCILTTKMSDEGFYERIDIICKAINAEYTVEEGVVVIKSGGCK